MPYGKLSAVFALFVGPFLCSLFRDLAAGITARRYLRETDHPRIPDFMGIFGRVVSEEAVSSEDMLLNTHIIRTLN